MNYIEKLASKIKSEVDPSLIPDQQDSDKLFEIYAVLMLAKGISVTNEDVHNAWSAWMSFTAPNHPSIVPYETLSKSLQDQDTAFKEAIIKVASAK